MTRHPAYSGRPPPDAPTTPFEAAVYAWVALVPRGKVVTYGQVAAHLGHPRAARAVGRALSRLLEATVPWHRVINAQGGLSVGGHPERPERQYRRLRRERVALSPERRVDLRRYRWRDGPLWDLGG